MDYRNIKLGGSFFCPNCRCTHSSAMTCAEIQAIRQREAEFLANLRETTEEEQTMQTQPLFTLTADEVEKIKNLLIQKIGNLEDLAAVYSKINTEESKLYESRIAEYNPLLNRIKQWQDEKNEPRNRLREREGGYRGE